VQTRCCHAARAELLWLARLVSIYHISYIYYKNFAICSIQCVVSIYCVGVALAAVLCAHGA
jgi:hypothetical protein